MYFLDEYILEEFKVGVHVLALLNMEARLIKMSVLPFLLQMDLFTNI